MFLTCVSLTDVDFEGIEFNNFGIDFDRKGIILNIMMILFLDCECKRAPGESDFNLFGQNLFDWFCLYKMLDLDLSFNGLAP